MEHTAEESAHERHDCLAGIIFDFVRPENLVSLGWAFCEAKNNLQVWNSVTASFFSWMKCFYENGGLLRKLEIVAKDKKLTYDTYQGSNWPMIADGKKVIADGIHKYQVRKDNEVISGEKLLDLDELNEFILNYEQ